MSGRNVAEMSPTFPTKLVFTKFEMQQFELDMGKLDSTDGTLASSQKDTLDKMKG